MGVRSITIPCSSNGFAVAQAWLEGYTNRLERNVNELINRMLQDGEMYAANYLGHVDTGETLSTIMGYREGNTGILLVGGNAIWIEFGTGCELNNTASHPKMAELNMSLWGTYGEGHGADAGGWYYPDDDGTWKHTRGIPMNKFFYNTAQMLRREYVRIAHEVFG